MLKRVKIILVLIVCCFLSVYGTDFSNWDKSVEITFDGYTGSALTNFPVLLIFEDGNPSGFNYADFASGSGDDLRFSKSDKSTELNYEIDTWDTSGSSKVWLQVPELTSNTTVYAYWGNSSVSAPSYTTNGSTWSNGFIAVWHMGETNTATEFDSASSYNALTSGSPTSTNGIVGRSVDINGSSGGYYSAGVVNDLDELTEATFSGWIYNDEITSSNYGDSAIFGRGTQSKYTTTIILWANMDGGGTSPTKSSYSFNIGSASGADNNRVNGTIACKEQQWQYVTATFNGKNRSLYVDGIFDVEQTNGIQQQIPTSSLSLNIGTWLTADSTMRTNGRLDELRVSSVERSADWIYAEWQNIASNSVFYTFGNVEPVPGTLFLFR